jgi:6-phosphogluconolactonase
MMKWAMSGTAMLAALAISACSDQTTTQPRRVTPPASFDRREGASSAGGGGVFTSSNGASGNVVFAFARRDDGVLSKTGEFPTGGNGVGGDVDPLQSQNSLVLAEDRQHLYVVNAGSNTVSTFAVAPNAALRLIGTISSGGERPISLALSNHDIFVLNSDNSVAALALDDAGVPRGAPVTRVSLGDASDGPSTIAASRDGLFLLVTERSANAINVLRTDANGALAVIERHPSNGAAPFGFAMTNRAQMIVSEAAGDAPNGAASSYDLARNGSLTSITSSLSTHQAAACWLVLSNTGRLAFVANAGSGSISAYAVASNGTLTALDPSGRTGITSTPDATPLDLSVTRDGKFLYALQTGTGTIGSFAIAADGRLTTLADTPGLATAAGFQGLAAY